MDGNKLLFFNTEIAEEAQGPQRVSSKFRTETQNISSLQPRSETKVKYVKELIISYLQLILKKNNRQFLCVYCERL